jgi:hypothetical protein
MKRTKQTLFSVEGVAVPARDISRTARLVSRVLNNGNNVFVSRLGAYEDEYVYRRGEGFEPASYGPRASKHFAFLASVATARRQHAYAVKQSADYRARVQALRRRK